MPQRISQLPSIYVAVAQVKQLQAGHVLQSVAEHPHDALVNTGAAHVQFGQGFDAVQLAGNRCNAGTNAAILTHIEVPQAGQMP